MDGLSRRLQLFSKIFKMTDGGEPKHFWTHIYRHFFACEEPTPNAWRQSYKHPCILVDKDDKVSKTIYQWNFLDVPTGFW